MLENAWAHLSDGSSLTAEMLWTAQSPNKLDMFKDSPDQKCSRLKGVKLETSNVWKPNATADSPQFDIHSTKTIQNPKLLLGCQSFAIA